jgi:hypothetical protein
MFPSRVWARSPGDNSLLIRTNRGSTTISAFVKLCDIRRTLPPEAPRSKRIAERILILAGRQQQGGHRAGVGFVELPAVGLEGENETG